MSEKKIKDKRRENPGKSIENIDFSNKTGIKEREEKPPAEEVEDLAAIAENFALLVAREGGKLLRYRNAFLDKGLNPYDAPMRTIVRFFDSFNVLAGHRKSQNET